MYWWFERDTQRGSGCSGLGMVVAEMWWLTWSSERTRAVRRACGAVGAGGCRVAAPRLRQPEQRQVTLRPVEPGRAGRRGSPRAPGLGVRRAARPVGLVSRDQGGRGPARPSAGRPAPAPGAVARATVEDRQRPALARLCAEHHAYRWLCGGVSVNHETLADFRVTRGGLLDGLLATASPP